MFAQLVGSLEGLVADLTGKTAYLQYNPMLTALVFLQHLDVGEAYFTNITTQDIHAVLPNPHRDDLQRQTQSTEMWIKTIIIPRLYRSKGLFEKRIK